MLAKFLRDWSNDIAVFELCWPKIILRKLRVYSTIFFHVNIATILVLQVGLDVGLGPLLGTGNTPADPPAPATGVSEN